LGIELTQRMFVISGSASHVAAWESYKQGEMGDAIISAGFAATSTPDNFETYYLLGRIIRDADRPSVAAGMFRRALAIIEQSEPTRGSNLMRPEIEKALQEVDETLASPPQ